MDIDLLAKLVRDIILEQDEVTLPGVGTFVSETIPAAFSDKLYTINPPYRRLSFRQRQGNDDLLVQRYAATSGLDEDRAREILRTFLYEMKEVLKVRKTIIFPNLGRLRATKENHFFFVSDENLDIFPQGFGLEPVSLKAHDNETVPHLDLVVPDTPAPVPENIQESLSAEKEPLPDQVQTIEDAPQQEQGQTVAEEPLPEQIQTIEDAQQQELIQTVAEESQPEQVQAIEEVQEIVGTAEEPQAAAEPDKAAAEPETVAVAKKKVATESVRPAKKHIWLRIILAIVIICIVILAAIAIIGRVAPDFIDQFLYTSEELEILNY